MARIGRPGRCTASVRFAKTSSSIRSRWADTTSAEMCGTSPPLMSWPVPKSVAAAISGLSSVPYWKAIWLMLSRYTSGMMWRSVYIWDSSVATAGSGVSRALGVLWERRCALDPPTASPSARTPSGRAGAADPKYPSARAAACAPWPRPSCARAKPPPAPEKSAQARVKAGQC